MTTYILRADDREWQLSGRLAREIRIEAFNILFREDIMQGTVWSQRASRKNGMRALWVIDIYYESFSKAVPTPTDSPYEWKKLTHAMAYDAWDDGIVIDKELFDDLAGRIITRPLIEKVRRTYLLSDGCRLEVNHVDAGQPGAFWYAEIEYPTLEAACQWDPAGCGLSDYLSDEVTGQPGQSMGAYWVRTRC